MKKLYVILFIIFLLSACASDWVRTTPPEDENFQYFVGVSKYKNSEQQARNEALYDANRQFAIACQVNISVISKYIEDYVKISDLEHDTINFVFDTKNSTNVNIYSIKAKEWRIVKKESTNDTKEKWKAYVLTSVPIGIEEKIRKYHNEIKKKCANFLNNKQYVSVRGQSFSTPKAARKDAIKAYNEIIKQETERKYGISLNIINDEEMNCSDDSNSYFILRIKKDKIEKQAEHEILKIAENLNYQNGLQLLEKNKNLFKKNDIHYKKFYTILERFNKAKKFVNTTFEKYRKIIEFENEQKIAEAFILINQIDTPTNLEIYTDSDKINFNNIILYKNRISILKYLKETTEEIVKLTEDYNISKDYKSKDKHIYLNYFYGIFDILKNSNEKDVKVIESTNTLLINYNKIINKVSEIFNNYYQNLLHNVGIFLNNFEPLKVQGLFTLQKIKSEIQYYFDNNFLLEKNKILYEQLSNILNKVNEYDQLQTVLQKKGFKYINPGEFLMGNNGLEMHLHLVKLTQPFYICEHEVKVEEYQKYWNLTGLKNINDLYCSQRNYVQAEGSIPCNDSNIPAVICHINNCDLSNWSVENNKIIVKEGRTDHPVNCVSWDDAIDYINWLNNEHPLSHNYYYHLCSEAQWEYSARGFKCARINNWKKDDLNYTCAEPRQVYKNLKFICDISKDKNCLSKTACYDRLCKGTCKVKSKERNFWNLYDMNGNVAEWVQDMKYSFLDRYIQSHATNFRDVTFGKKIPIYIDPIGKKNKNLKRLYKGGSYWSSSDGENMKVSERDTEKPSHRSTSIGIRLCISKKNEGGF